MDKGTLYRLAASYLGESCVEENTALSQAFQDVHQHAISLALDYTIWPFALARVTLSALPDGGYLLPPDCLEIRQCSLSSFELIGRTLYPTSTTNSNITLTYKSSAIADTLCLPDYEPYFCEGCALLLAAKAAPRVSASLKIAQGLEADAFEKLYRAKLKISRSIASNDQEPIPLGTLSTISSIERRTLRHG